MGIAAVYDDVAGIEKRHQLIDKMIDSHAGFDHQHDFARLFQLPDQFLERIGGNDVQPPGPAFDKAGDFFHCPVEYADRETFRLHVHDQIFAHYRQADQADIGLRHISRFLKRSIYSSATIN